MEHPTDRELEGYARGVKPWVAGHVALCLTCQAKLKATLPPLALTMAQAWWAARR